VARVDGAPGEDGREPAEGDEPVEHVDLDAGFAGCGEGEGAEERGGEDCDEGPAFAVDVAEDGGGLALFGEGGERAAAAVDAAVADAEDGDEDDDVHDAGEGFDAGVLDADYEGRGFGVVG